MPDDALNPVVARFVDAINAGDSAGLFAVLTSDATMSDDGTDRVVEQWIESEVFGSNGRLDVASVSDGGTALVGEYTNDRWGTMRTAWRFTVSGGRISRFETGQA